MKSRAILFVLFLTTALAVVPVNKACAASDIAVHFVTSPPLAINAGETYSFSVNVENLGPDNATNIILEYRPPLRTSIVFIHSTGPGEVGTKNDPHDPALIFLGSRAPGQTVMASFRVRVDDDVPPGTLLDNDIRVYQAGGDTEPPNNQLNAFVQVVEGKVADLRLRMVGKPDGRVKTGENLTYTAIVENLGPSKAVNVVLRMQLISSGTFKIIDMGATQGSHLFGTSSLGGFPNFVTTAHFELDNMTAGSQATCLVRLSADTVQDINNLAEVTWDHIDRDIESNYVETVHEVVSPSLVGGFLIPPDGALIPLLMLMGIGTVVYEAVRRKRKHT